jgi:4-amino-4-deoxy-L-arabinose transferase-like glycosyltransferase
VLTRRVAAAAVGVAAFVVYALTAARDIIPGDTPEFVTVALTGGVAHPPGYPLLSILGVVFGQLPLGPLPFRIDLISVVCHAGTVVLVFLTADRLVRNTLASAAAALVLAFGRGFWTWSLVAETFPLNDLLAALVLYLLVVWHERPTASAPLIGAAAAFGLGMANQQTISLLLPAIAVVLYTDRAALRGRPIVLRCAAVAIVAAILPYGYVAIVAGRHAVMNWGGIQGPGDLLRQILRLDYGTGQLVATPGYQGGNGLDRLAAFAGNVNPLLALLAIAGAVYAYRRMRWYFWTVATAFLICGPLFIAYANANVAVATARFLLMRFYLLPQVVFAPLAALGIVFVAELARRRIADPPRWLPSAVAGAVLVLAVVEVAVAYGGVDRSGDHVARHFAEDILATAPAGSIVLASGDHVVLPLIYLQAVEGAKPDITVIAWPLLGLDWYQRELKLRHPELNLPFARYELGDGLLTLVRANPDRRFVLTGEEAQSLQGTYGIFPQGLTLPIVDAKQLLDLTTVAQANEQLLASYRIPSLAEIDKDSFERFIVTWYALVAFRVGAQYENAKQYAPAQSWYERALVIDPQLPEALNGLRRVQGK